MANPILKIKRGTNLVPTNLSNAELAVDLEKNKLYVGRSTGVVPIGTSISAESTLGGANASDEIVPTQKAAKKFIDDFASSSPPPPPSTTPPKDTAIIRMDSISTNIDLTSFQYPDTFLNIWTGDQTGSFNPSYVQTIGNTKLIAYDPVQGSNSIGLYQTSKTEIIYRVNYSVYFTAPSQTTEFTTLGWWRSFGIQVWRKSSSPFIDAPFAYYGMQTVAPNTYGITGPGTTEVPMSTMLNGMALVRLPKSDVTANYNVYEMRFAYKRNSVVGNAIALGYREGFGNQIPLVGENYSIRVEITKLYESDI